VVLLFMNFNSFQLREHITKYSKNNNSELI
jgi:hypothetical protein